MSTGRGFVAVTPSDSVDISRNASGAFPTALRFGTGGSCTVVGADGSTAAFTNIQDGEIIPVAARRVNSTGLTGVADIVGFYE